jgi:hypothetical protein
MNLVRLLIAIAFLVLASLILQFVTAPFGVQASAFEFMKSIRWVVAGIFWSFVIWGLVSVSRGKDKTPDISSFILVTSGIILLLFAVYDLFVI